MKRAANSRRPARAAAFWVDEMVEVDTGVSGLFVGWDFMLWPVHTIDVGYF